MPRSLTRRRVAELLKPAFMAALEHHEAALNASDDTQYRYEQSRWVNMYRRATGAPVLMFEDYPTPEMPLGEDAIEDLITAAHHELVRLLMLAAVGQLSDREQQNLDLLTAFFAEEPEPGAD